MVPARFSLSRTLLCPWQGIDYFTGKGKVQSQNQQVLKAREGGDVCLAAAANLLQPKESSSPHQALISETQRPSGTL